MKKNIKVLVIEIVVIALAIIGVALAINYVMDSIGITASTADLAVTYTGSTTLPSTSLAPVNDSAATYNTSNTSIMKVDFTIKGAVGNPNKPIIYDVILEDLDLSCYLKNENLKWKLFKNGTQLTTGNFSPTFDVMKDNKLFLTTIQQDLPTSSSTADSYQLLVWISESCTSADITTCTQSQDQSKMLGETISGKVQAVLYTDSKKALTRTTGSALTCNYDKSGANAPALTDGLIPVTYNVTNGWVKADVSNVDGSWYNYDKKQWANAVLVSSTNRVTYQNASAGTPIPESDVLAYYVWIPRYKYKVWNVTKTIGVDSYDAEHTGIDIKFENVKETTGSISCTYNFNVDPENGGIDLNTTTAETCTCDDHVCTSSDNGNYYYTHPAFTFGEDELEGLWVGKFELSSETPNVQTDCIYRTTTYIANDYCGGGLGITLTPRIKPNVRVWGSNTLSNFWKVIYDMQISNNIYGLSTDRTNIDTHMSRNLEWGAVAYLTNSKYGRCTNNNCSAVTINEYPNVFYTGGNNYKENTNQTTTGNIYGVYDMAGGAYEVVMGNMSSNGQMYEYYALDAGTNYTYVGNEKYIDAYSQPALTNGQTSYNITKLGDISGEMAKSEGFACESAELFIARTNNNQSVSYSWFDHGGAHRNGVNLGIYRQYVNHGEAYHRSNMGVTSTRAVLVSLK